jgi:hypothetical protein
MLVTVDILLINYFVGGGLDGKDLSIEDNRTNHTVYVL